MDKIELLNSRLKEVVACYQSWKDNGMSEEILIAWFMVKMKVSRTCATKIVTTYEEFFNELIKTETLKRIEDSD